MKTKLLPFIHSPLQLGYCSNVHAGSGFEQVVANLKLHTLEVKRRFRPETAMGIGLWFSNDACQQLRSSHRVHEFAAWLQQKNLLPFTFNAFPFHDFHQPVVKHRVYQPTWADEERLRYTREIADIQSQLLGELTFGTVSTLPLGWRSEASADFYRRCGKQLIRCVEFLAELEEKTGKQVMLCIEPEPGCVIESSDGLVQFYQRYLLGKSAADDQRLRRYLGVCHDICHSAVMFEPQRTAIENYRQAEISVGKIQVSSALHAEFGLMDKHERITVLEMLRQFAEDRYLHQTTVREAPGQHFYEDLSAALQQHQQDLRGSWRVHFHVPVFAERLAVIDTTQAEIRECLAQLGPPGPRPLHLEIETYAWTVLPPPLQSASLAEGISRELIWFRDEFLTAGD